MSQETTMSILVVDDDESVRDLVVGMLAADYQVTSCGSGREALTVWDSEGPFDLLVVDVQLTDMLGPEMLGALQASHPGLRALLVSGGVGADNTEFPVLHKPFTAPVLRARVRDLLAQDMVDDRRQ